MSQNYQVQTIGARKYEVNDARKRVKYTVGVGLRLQICAISRGGIYDMKVRLQRYYISRGGICDMKSRLQRCNMKVNLNLAAKL